LNTNKSTLKTAMYKFERSLGLIERSEDTRKIVKEHEEWIKTNKGNPNFSASVNLFLERLGDASDYIKSGM
jgi:hypothetical protein